ncbi:hypothetical protein FE257_010046 [Aspergillus nanangensis]|uniref:Pentatricopeptide repeat protein n=1 Tax=Aspergillus nanangensis TaxID=2582783 RepID=A0AAD4GYF9_ASPNN|nr:hypothetical protein FE257_010046 [Aspergillus nanangensis]
MLRGSNVHALRTGVSTGMALRVSSLGTRWPSALWRRSNLSPTLRVSLHSLVAIPSPTTRAWHPVGLKQYSTESHHPSDNPAATVADETQATHKDQDPEVKESKENERTREPLDPLLGVAMAGTSPKVRGDTDSSFEGRSISSKVVEMELKWLQDPRALADRVARLLQAGDFALAAALVRGAQADRIECSVAWNHLMEHSLKKGNPKAAFKFYNDMKKRGRKPSSHTFTIMLKGLSNAPKNTGLNPVKTAYSIYTSISASNSAVERNIIHSNAMLNVCWRQGDMDTLWQVAGELPDSGPGSPDPTTYSTILSAIRQATEKDVAGMRSPEPQRVLARREQGIKEGKRVWSDIIYQWKNGRLALDNTLVSSMATLLLEGGTERDYYDVFALINQTTGLPILSDLPPPPKRESKPVSILKARRGSARLHEEMDDVPFVDEGNRLYRPLEPEQDAVKEKDEEVEEEEDFDDLFDPFIFRNDPIAPTQKTSEDKLVPAYLPVTNRELSILLETCLAMHQSISTGKAYWNYLTLSENEHKVIPDSGSFHQYLRLLRIGRSSRATIDLIRDQMAPAGIVEGRTFIIALSCCQRDRNNINVLKNANELLALMNQHLMLPDIKALGKYFEIIRTLGENPYLLVSLNGLGSDKKKRSTSSLGGLGRELLVSLRTGAIEQLSPLIRKLNVTMQHGVILRGAENIQRVRHVDHNAIQGFLALNVLTQMRALIDITLKQEKGSPLISKDLRKRLQKEVSPLKRYSNTDVITKFRPVLVLPTPEQRLAFEDRKLEFSSVVQMDGESD